MTTFFRGNLNIGEVSITEAVEENLISYLDWCFLELGTYSNVRIPTSGVHGGVLHKLRHINDPRYNNGQVWESNRNNWVWESGLKRVDEQPIAISGVYVNNNFLPRGSGYCINYRNGQVVFDEPISVNSDVNIEYSYKYINVTSASNIPWFRVGQTRSFRPDDILLPSSSGIWNNLADTRVQLPAVAIECTDRTSAGYQLGGGQWCRSQVVLHIISENNQITKRLASILSDQNENTIYMYDPDMLAEQNRYPLDYRGDLAENPLCYPDLIEHSGVGGFRYTNKVQHGKMRIYDIHEQNHGKITENIFHSTVKWRTEVILPKI
jgi:hypothetical protein